MPIDNRIVCCAVHVVAVRGAASQPAVIRQGKARRFSDAVLNNN